MVAAAAKRVGPFLETGDDRSALNVDARVPWSPHKGVRWMPWYNMAMKDVAACEKLRGGGKQPLIRRYPNGATLLPEWAETLS